MRYRTFGRLTGLRVSESAPGAGNFGTAGDAAGFTFAAVPGA
jgi:hypothetical protein